MDFSEKFIKLRKSASLTQEQAAEKLGVSRQAISRWEQGTALPDALNIAGICMVFGVSADYLIGDKEIEVHDPVVQRSGEMSPASLSENSVVVHANMNVLLRALVCVHIFAFGFEFAGIICFVTSAVTAFWLLAGIGFFLSLASIVIFEVAAGNVQKAERSRLRRKYYSSSVWLFTPLPLLISGVFAAWLAVLACGLYGSVTIPVFLIAGICLVLYILVGVFVNVACSCKKTDTKN